MTYERRPGASPFGTSAAYDRGQRTSGDITCNSTTWANLDNNLDLDLTGAVAGDWVMVGVNFRWNNEAVFAWIDCVTVVGGSPVNSLSGANGASGEGVSGWGSVSASYAMIGGSIAYQLVSGDIEAGGAVKLRFRYRTLTAANKTIRATTDGPLTVWARRG